MDGSVKQMEGLQRSRYETMAEAAQLQDQDNGVRPRTGGEDTSADFLAGFVLGLLGVKEPWGVNNEKLSPLPFPACFLTSFGNSVGSNLRLEYFFPEDECKATTVLIIASTDISKKIVFNCGQETSFYIGTNEESALGQLPKMTPLMMSLAF
ncbi:hypothetical protein Celaphus_00012416 [Cervus elaphus hippelaphus]|uniref:Uncharacterized protein n=1 Tax=Cervus elaphus hippelaphus TaxID=46360 RepID=A0A212CKB3_CEREH|nr:hypothetical protein Celaphus_00012416 [Cervus elaphus hippelaphus]